MNPVYGLVTVDVEPDNVWADTKSNSFENIRHLPRFHDVCRQYGVLPTYLVTHSIATDPGAAKILAALAKTGNCEIGAHTHLWETPPFSVADDGTAKVGNLYPTEALIAKFENLTKTLRDRFDNVVTHRAGRWGFDSRQAAILAELNYIADTSYTPGLDWTATGAPDYTDSLLEPHLIEKRNRLLEVPCTIRPSVFPKFLLRHRATRAVIGRLGLPPQWLRCTPTSSRNSLLSICAWAVSCLPHLNIMTHSSELSPGTSPMWRTEADIELHLEAYRTVFSWWQHNGILPVTLGTFAEHQLKKW